MNEHKMLRACRQVRALAKLTRHHHLPRILLHTFQEEVPGGRGTANVVGKCKGCRKDYSVSVLNDRLATYDVQDSGKFKTIAAFECRGVELASYKPSGNWQCE